jgi:hypothetical protein
MAAVADLNRLIQTELIPLEAGLNPVSIDARKYYGMHQFNCFAPGSAAICQTAAESI